MTTATDDRAVIEPDELSVTIRPQSIPLDAAYHKLETARPGSNAHTKARVGYDALDRGLTKDPRWDARPRIGDGMSVTWNPPVPTATPSYQREDVVSPLLASIDASTLEKVA